MPIRKTPLVTGQYYHVFNRGIEKRHIFLDKRDYQRAIETIYFYRYLNLPFKLSRYFSLSINKRGRILSNIETNLQKGVEISCYNFMPNHFHFLLQQVSDEGVSQFLRKITDSYTKFFNKKYERVGPLFQGQFKAVLIESEEQFLHVSRYIHLNPFTSFIIKTIGQLKDYPWSSLNEYLNNQKFLCEKSIITSHFPIKEDYLKFIADQADYQRSLEYLKHLTLD